MAFLNNTQLKNLGLKSYGENVYISDKASIYSAHLISIGSNVRIDDFCILSGTISLGNFIHIAAYSALYGKFGIQLEDFTGLSPRCTIFSASDDFSGEFMVSPMVPDELTNVSGGKVTIKRFSQIGAGTVILPNVTLEEGSAVGSMSLIKQDCEKWSIYGGCPAKKLKSRKHNILNLHRLIK